jgi:hypothetical protein
VAQIRVLPEDPYFGKSSGSGCASEKVSSDHSTNAHASKTAKALGSRFGGSTRGSKLGVNVGTDGTYPGFLGTIACSDRLVNVPSVRRFLCKLILQAGIDRICHALA